MSATSSSSNCCDGSDDTIIDKYAPILSSAKSIGYNIKELIYTFIFHTWIGCRNPIKYAHIKEREREIVLDLGSSAGINVFFASNIVK